MLYFVIFLLLLFGVFFVIFVLKNQDRIYTPFRQTISPGGLYGGQHTGFWEIDEHGVVREISGGTLPRTGPFGSGVLDPKEVRGRNIYILNIFIRSKRIVKAEAHVIAPLPRAEKAEAALRRYFQTALVNQVDSKVMERSGGVEQVVDSIIWEEFPKS